MRLLGFRYVARASVHMEQLGSHGTDFYEIWYLSIFSKKCMENRSIIKIGQELRILYMKTNIHFYHISLNSS